MTRLFYISVIAICAIELYLAHLVDIAYGYANIGWSDLVAVEMALIAVMGITHSTARHRSIVGVVAIWMIWVALTDWVPIFPGWLYSIETTLFCLLIGWLSLRPERLPSYFGPNVGIAFYSGTRAPLVAQVISLFGLPFNGVALFVNGYLMMPRRKAKKLVRVELKDVSRQWTILDTHSETTPEIKAEFDKLEGKPVTMANCVSLIKPVLDILGYHSNTPGGLALEVLNGGR